MKLRHVFGCVAFSMIVAGVLGVGGCGKSDAGKTASGTKAPVRQTGAAEQPKAPLIPKTEIADWCKEHGVPESVCTKCNTALIAQFKEKGDWCKEHDAPESQCFACHPELEAKFAAQYEAKYGKRPPQREKVN